MNLKNQEYTITLELKAIYFGVCSFVINSTKVIIHSFVNLTNMCAESPHGTHYLGMKDILINETNMISPLTELILYEEQVLTHWKI